MRQRFEDMGLQPGDLVVFRAAGALFSYNWEETPLIFVGIDGPSHFRAYEFLRWSGCIQRFADGLWDCEILSRVAEALG